MKSKIIKALIIGIVVIVIGTGGYAGYNKFFAKTAAAATAKFYSSTIKTMSIAKTIQGTGAAYAGTASAIVPNNNGTISGLTVKVGDTVTAAQKLFVCSNSNLTKAVTDATDKLTKANEQLTSDESDTKVGTNKISDDQTSVTEATTVLSDANSAVTSQTVASPIAGLVTSVDGVNGGAGDSSKSLLTVSDMSTMKVKVSVDELDISSVAIGQKATIKFDALADKTFTGAVESVGQLGATTSNVTTYDVVVSISVPTGIRLGMNANVTIAVQSKDKAIVIPEEALVESNGKKYVRVSDTTDSNSAQTSSVSSTTQSSGKLVEITTGIQTQDYVEVTKGVTEGETVLIQLPSSSSSVISAKGGFGGRSGAGGGGLSGAGGQRAGNAGSYGSKSTTTK